MKQGAQNGMTLLEIMIVVAIIAIIAAIAYPTYSSYMKSARRAEGKTLLLEVIQREERYKTENLTYTTNLAALGYPAGNLLSEHGDYKVTLSACGAKALNLCVQATATGQGRQAADGNLTLASDGTRTPANHW